MKTYISIIGFLLLFNPAFSQEGSTSKQTNIEKQIADKSFRFEPDFLYPMSGQRRFITDGSFLQITKDKIVSDLPFFGEAYVAGYNEPGGVKFTSEDFTYVQTRNKKGNIEITIEPKDVRSVSGIMITVFKNGKADVRVISTTRSAISYDGTIKPVEK